MQIGDVILTKTLWHWWNKLDRVQYKHPEKDHTFCFLFLGSRDMKSATPVDANGILNDMGWRFLNHLKVTAVFETVDEIVSGSTSVPVKRIETQDDDSITVVLDYWPAPAKTLYGYSVERENFEPAFFPSFRKEHMEFCVSEWAKGEAPPTVVELFR